MFKNINALCIGNNEGGSFIVDMWVLFCAAKILTYSEEILHDSEKFIKLAENF